MERIAQALLERETLDREEIQTLERGDPLPPMPDPEEEEGVTPTLAEKPAAAPEKAKRPFGLGGEGPIPGPAPG